MAVRRVTHFSLDDRRAQGKVARERTPPSSHAGWAPATDRPDPVGLLEEQNLTREPDLVPARADVGLAVHLLPRGGQDHGRRPRRHAHGRAPGPALRRRPPGELRSVRLPPPPALAPP